MPLSANGHPSLAAPPLPAPVAGQPRMLDAALAAMDRLLTALHASAAVLDELARWTADRIVGGSRLLVCGNGGSAAEAQHFAAELVGRFQAERRPLPAVALGADGALLTCLVNDYPPDHMFARQVAGLGKLGDLLVGLSTSGRSRNVAAALTTARALGLHTLALLGKGGGDMAGLAEREWIVPSPSTARVQEAHLLFLHVVCDHVDAALLAGSAREEETRSCPPS
jgi:D-sedoheptulose 7-phosphate isomerase